MYDDVLLPTDSSRGVARATEHAIDAAAQADATLHVLYVVDEETYGSYPGDEYVHELEGLEHALEEVGEDAVERIADRAAEAGVDVRTEIRHGVPHEEILGYMADHDVGLTVLGTKHRPDEYRRLLGSVTARVVRHAERPVAVVKTPVEEE